jgi:hypothetical protein
MNKRTHTLVGASKVGWSTHKCRGNEVSVHVLVTEYRANNNVIVANKFFEKCGKAQIFGNDTNK